MAHAASVEPFALHGCEKMLYDVRMGPQALLRDGRIFVAYQSNGSGKPAHPFVRVFDVQRGEWSAQVQVGEVSKYDHHFAPAIWFDGDGHLHMLCHCHNSPGEHRVSRRPGDISEWAEAPPVAPVVSYPRLFRLAGGELLIYYRTHGHLGHWGYRLSQDGGYTWGEKRTLVDLDLNAVTEDEKCAGSYHTVLPSQDGKSLHVGFVRKREFATRSALYGEPVPKAFFRYHFFCLRADLASGRVFDADGRELTTPLALAEAERCKVWDTGEQFTNMPAMALDGRGAPCFILPVSSQSSMWDCGLHFVRRDGSEWRRTMIARTNHVWSASALRREPDGLWRAFLVVDSGNGHCLHYGGGRRVEEWVSSNGGEQWDKKGEIVPEDGLLYNNPRFVELEDGSPAPGYLLLYGWPGPSSISGKDTGDGSHVNRGRAFLWREGEWL